MMLDGKSIIVTGGGSGIGRATCILAAEEGARVAIADIFAGAAQSDALQDGDVVPDDRGLADDHARAVVDQDALPQPRRGVTIHREHRADARL